METKHGGSSVEDRLRRLLGAATARFETMREDMRDMERHKEHHDLLLSSLEALLAVCGGNGDVCEREGDRVREGVRGRERERERERGKERRREREKEKRQRERSFASVGAS